MSSKQQPNKELQKYCGSGNLGLNTNVDIRAGYDGERFKNVILGKYGVKGLGIGDTVDLWLNQLERPLSFGLKYIQSSRKISPVQMHLQDFTYARPVHDESLATIENPRMITDPLSGGKLLTVDLLPVDDLLKKLIFDKGCDLVISSRATLVRTTQPGRSWTAIVDEWYLADTSIDKTLTFIEEMFMQGVSGMRLTRREIVDTPRSRVYKHVHEHYSQTSKGK